MPLTIHLQSSDQAKTLINRLWSKGISGYYCENSHPLQGWWFVFHEPIELDLFHGLQFSKLVPANAPLN